MSAGQRASFAAGDEHPRQCPWCGQSRVRGVMPSPDGNRWYRCTACATTFFIHVTSKQPADLGSNLKAES
jgi:transposase-like protein